MDLPERIQINKFAVKYDPPTLIVQYVRNKSTKVKCIKIKTTHTKDVENIVNKLVSTFPELLGEEVANRDQVKDLVQRIMDHEKKATSDDEFGDLNKADDDELLRAKNKMSSTFESNRLKPGDPGYVWDKQVDFGPPSTAAPSDWDSEDD